MYKRMVLGFLLVFAPTAAWAQTIQENYLPPKSQFYFRWDGMDMHRADFDKTAVGKMMKGDTGKFLDELWKFTNDNLQIIGQQEPKLGPALKDFTKLLSTMHQSGLVVAVEVSEIKPQPKAQLVMVFPKGAGESGTLLPLVQRIAEEVKAPIKNNKVGKRFVNHVEFGPGRFGWWAEGEDAILLLGTTDPVEYAKAIDSKQMGLAKNPLYKKVAGFKEFKTASRGFFDIGSALNVASEIAPPISGKIVDELGLRSLKSVTFVSGFDGPAERSVVDVDIPGPRTGLLSFSSQKKISLKDLPVLPDDLSGFSASTIKLDKSYGTIIKLVDNIARIFDPNIADQIKDGVKDFEDAIGVNIDADLFGSFGEMMVSYSSPSDGFLGTGAVVAIQIKDGKKLANSLDKLVKGVPAIPAGGKLSLTKKQYMGGEIMQLQMAGGPASSHLASFGIYKGWFVYAQYPQPIKGFILRQEGKLPAWKADESLNKVLAQFPKEFNSINVSDPRPTVKTVLSTMPFIFNLVNSVGTPFVPGFRPFDIEVIPHAQEATMHLFPNVTIGVDNGKSIRAETRGSLILPF